MDCSTLGLGSRRSVPPADFVGTLRSVGGRVTAAHSEARSDRPATIQQLATRCADAAVDRVDVTITEVLAALGDTLSLSRCVAYVPSDDAQTLQAAYVWSREGQTTLSDGFDIAAAMPWLMSKLRTGSAVTASTLVDLPSVADREWLRVCGICSCLAVPLSVNGVHGALVADSSEEQTWASDVVDALRLLAAVVGQALGRRRDHNRMESKIEELRQQRTRVSNEDALLRRDHRAMQPDRTIAADSVAIRRVLDQVRQVAPTTATVLLFGETGVGKEVFAQAIHNLSPRQRRTMIRVSCAAIPAALIESELFGRERGAFTGALSRQIGRFEAANGSTIFLDEIGDLPLDIQVKLLRVIQERTVERLGGNESMKVDVRIIAATNRNLEHAVSAGLFREDLFYRLNVFPITVPPLRERIEDIPGLVWTFVDEFSRAFGKRIETVSKESVAALQRYNWPGNVRELRNVIEREMIIATGPTLTIGVPRPLSAQRRSTSTKLVDVEVEHIRGILESCGWRVRGTGGAAERLGVKPTTLESRMTRLGIVRERRATA
jgi:formate hydrogenlyase transcriptional activator